MNQEQLSREIADFAFWQQTQNECDRGYVRSGNSVMRRALELLEYDEQLIERHKQTYKKETHNGRQRNTR